MTLIIVILKMSLLNITSNGTDIRLQKSTGEYMGKFISCIELYHDDSKKFETT